MVDKANLTEERIRAIAAPSAGEYVLWDSKISGFGVRCFPSGRKVFILMYRPAGGGRAATKRRMTLGDIEKVKLGAARSAAQTYLGQIAGGADPQADRKAVARRDAARLDRALESYETHLKKRHVVHAEQIVRNLKRYMPGPIDQIDLPSIDRQLIAARIAKIEEQSVADTAMQKTSKTSGALKKSVSKVKRRVGGPGAAADFRTKAHTFFNWAVGRGLMYANPLAGWRRERITRAQMTGRTGRALSDAEIKIVWGACEKVAKPYGDYVRLLLLTGQRRTEASLLQWDDIDAGTGIWTIPAGVAKNGRAHAVPLTVEARLLVDRQPRFAENPYVFSGRNKGSAISNWSKRQGELVKLSGVSFTLHDLRRTFRSGLRKLGVDSELAEMMLNHAREELIEIYDREPKTDERREAAELWAKHVGSLVEPPADAPNVIPIHSRSTPQSPHLRATSI
ncbi:integrase arm-type DNA-binding domain-containing protein [Mesorhizobium sp. M0077]|uniref:tyrosine-type recombinase/integrase n=1 Tax=unclassified Mesorhizobium TaxID=325217 RepID=UPI00333D9141